MQENLHVAMIMDGNRRWAQDKGLPKLAGHKYGAEKLTEVLDWCLEAKVRALTLYTLSTENLNRPKEEVEMLFTLFRQYFKKFIKDKRIKTEDVRINFLGKLTLLPLDLQELFQSIMDETKNHKKTSINFCIAYGGHQEIIDAVNNAVKNGKEVDEKEFVKLLYTEDLPDLVIRTGGAMRTSNFLPWQTAYSEWFFIETYWPALTKEEFFKILEYFEKRKRNFGK